MNTISIPVIKLVNLIVICGLPFWGAAQKDTVPSKFGVHFHGGLGMSYQDNAFAERFVEANLNDAIDFSPYMFAGFFGVGFDYKRLGIEFDGTSSITGNSSSKNKAILSTLSSAFNLTYVFGRFEHIDLKGLVGMEARRTSLVAENQLTSPVPYNTMVSKIGFTMFTVGGDILWTQKPATNKHLGAYLGLRLRYGRSLGNNGWDYVPVQNVNGDHLNTFLLGILIGVGTLN